jgi:N-acetylglutamate synthase-like GNAT family acetyltransferase
MRQVAVDIVDTNADTVADCGFCGFKNTKQEGYRRKVAWLRKRFDEGLKFKVLEARGEGAVGFIEYIPGEYTWRPIEAPGYMVIHCVMIHRKEFKGKGYGKLLVEECLEDAKREKMHGVAVVTSGGTWMASRDLFSQCGFETVDTAPPSFELLVKRLRKTSSPTFKTGWDAKLRRYGSGLTIIQSDQCPCIAKSTADILEACDDLGMRPNVVDLKSGRQARAAPSAYGIFNIVYDGELVAEHPISATRFRNIMRKVM